MLGRALHGERQHGAVQRGVLGAAQCAERQHGAVQGGMLGAAQCAERQQVLKLDTVSNVGPAESLLQGKRSSDLAQPVPLDILVKHNFMQPGTDCISCKLIVS